MVKLKPCPFCGKEMRITGTWCNWSVLHVDSNPPCGIWMNGRIKKDLIRTWNRRAKP
jgi:hypothetical protein